MDHDVGGARASSQCEVTVKSDMGITSKYFRCNSNACAFASTLFLVAVSVLGSMLDLFQ